MTTIDSILEEANKDLYKLDQKMNKLNKKRDEILGRKWELITAYFLNFDPKSIKTHEDYASITRYLGMEQSTGAYTALTTYFRNDIAEIHDVAYYQHNDVMPIFNLPSAEFFANEDGVNKLVKLIKRFHKTIDMETSTTIFAFRTKTFGNERYLHVLNKDGQFLGDLDSKRYPHLMESDHFKTLEASIRDLAKYSL